MHVLRNLGILGAFEINVNKNIQKQVHGESLENLGNKLGYIYMGFLFPLIGASKVRT